MTLVFPKSKQFQSPLCWDYSIQGGSSDATMKLAAQQKERKIKIVMEK